MAPGFEVTDRPSASCRGLELAASAAEVVACTLTGPGLQQNVIMPFAGNGAPGGGMK